MESTNLRKDTTAELRDGRKWQTVIALNGVAWMFLALMGGLLTAWLRGSDWIVSGFVVLALSFLAASVFDRCIR